MWVFESAHRYELLKALVEHVELCASTLAMASMIALPLGYALSRSQRLAEWVLGILSLLYAIPSMALMALLVPVFGLGVPSALMVLVAYAQFLLLRNVILAFQSIEPTLVEVGQGLGFSAWQRFTQVELPLALPTLIGGFRVATTATIAIASLAAWINAGGLGNVLFEGIYQHHIPKLISGSLLLVGLGLTMDMALADLQKLALRESQGAMG